MTRSMALAALCGLALACGRTGLLDETADAGTPPVDAGRRIPELTELRGCVYLGGYDRLRIFGESVDPSGCGWMQFTAPGVDGYVHHVDIFEPWGLTFIGFRPGARCPEVAFEAIWSEPTHVEGKVEPVGPVPQHGYPGRVSVDVLAHFDADAGTPAALRFRNDAVEFISPCRAP